MSLKAGRVGVNPADVDPIDGHISPESVDSYTKAQADAKFETQEAAALLQPKTLIVPISMLQGSLLVPKTTVEDVIQTMDNAMTNAEMSDLLTVKEYTDKLASRNANIATVQVAKIKKTANINELNVSITIGASNISAWTNLLQFEGITPISGNINAILFNNTDNSGELCLSGIYTDSYLQTNKTLVANKKYNISFMWIG